MADHDLAHHIHDPEVHIKNVVVEGRYTIVPFRAPADQTITEADVQAFLDSLSVTRDDVLHAVHVKQRSPEWLRLRLDRIGASVSHAFRGTTTKCTWSDTATAMLFGSGNLSASFACSHGTRNEPRCEAAAIEDYYRETNAAAIAANAPTIDDYTMVHEGTLIWPRHPMFNASTDGIAIVKFTDGKYDCFACEWKCPLSPQGYSGKVPIEYYYQMQQQLTIYKDSGHLEYLLKQRGIDMSKDMVDGWKWRAMFGVWHKVLIHRQFIAHNEEAFMKHVQYVRDIYIQHYAPRAILRNRGVLRRPCIDVQPDLEINLVPSDSDSDDEGDRTPPAASDATRKLLGVVPESMEWMSM